MKLQKMTPATESLLKLGSRNEKENPGRRRRGAVSTGDSRGDANTGGAERSETKRECSTVRAVSHK